MSAVLAALLVFGVATGTGTADAAGGTSKTCGPGTGEDGVGGQCILEAPGFPGGRARLRIDVNGGPLGAVGAPARWGIDNLKAGGGCEGTFRPSDPPRIVECTLPAGTLSAVISRPPGSSATLGIQW